MSNRRSISLVHASPTVNWADGAEGRDEERLARLARIIEAEIVPRLLISSRAPKLTASIHPPGVRPADAVTELAQLLLAPEHEAADHYVRSMRERGASSRSICVQLLAPVARRLGELWERDECDFVELTMGLRRLESVLRTVSAACTEPARAAHRNPGAT